jgi:hypothetical protein
MCFRNGIQYGCPSYHLRLNTLYPFTLCSEARHYPIQRQCDNVITRWETTDEWCDDCVEEEIREAERARRRGYR